MRTEAKPISLAENRLEKLNQTLEMWIIAAEVNGRVALKRNQVRQ